MSRHALPNRRVGQASEELSKVLASIDVYACENDLNEKRGSEHML